MPRVRIAANNDGGQEGSDREPEEGDEQGEHPFDEHTSRAELREVCVNNLSWLEDYAYLGLYCYR